MDLSVIIVNHNTASFLERCLESVFTQKGMRFEVFVVDNASRDHSRQTVKDSFPRVHLIKNEINTGFSYANNQALEEVSGEFVYFLNPDTRVRPDAFKRIKAFLMAHPEVGLAGTQIFHPDGSPQPSVERRYPGGRHGEKAHRELAGDIAWVLGASMAGRRSMILEIGGFDEQFYLYGEDADLCLRARKAGYRVGFIPDATVVHWGGVSERGRKRLAVWEKKIRAEALFFKKHYSKAMCRRIHREGLLQAYWRLLSIGPMRLLPGKIGEESREKRAKYRAVVKEYRWNP